MPLNDIVYDKNVVIVGPSACATLNPPGYINSFDIVVRVNHQYPSNIPELGQRVDVWYHCLAPLRPFSNLMVPNLKWVGHTGRGKAQEVFEYWDEHNIPHTDISQFRDMLGEEIGCKPNMGLTAIALLLQSTFKSLYITGFTFYQEPYHSGYPITRFGDDKQTTLDPKEQMHQMQMLDWFIDTITERVTVDRKLSEIITRRECQKAAARMQYRKGVEYDVIDEGWCCCTTKGIRDELIKVRGTLFSAIDAARPNHHTDLIKAQIKNPVLSYEGNLEPGMIVKIEAREGEIVFRETILVTDYGIEVLTIPARAISDHP